LCDQAQYISTLDVYVLSINQGLYVVYPNNVSSPSGGHFH